MNPILVGHQTRSKQPVKQPNVVGICSFLNADRGQSRYEIVSVKGCHKPFMCGEHVMENSKEYPYALPVTIK